MSINTRRDPPDGKLPPALANYGVVELANGLIILPGQGCRDPLTNQCVGITRGPDGSIAGYDIDMQARGVFRNIAALLEGCGLTLTDIVDATVFMVNKSDFGKMNAIWNEIFPNPQQVPARTTVFVKDLPGDNFIEIKAVASRVPRV